MIYYTVLHDVMLSMHPRQLPVPAGMTVARKTQSCPGWLPLCAALMAHAITAALLLQGHPPEADAPPPASIDVVLEAPPVPMAPPPEAPEPPPATAQPEPPAGLSAPLPQADPEPLTAVPPDAPLPPRQQEPAPPRHLKRPPSPLRTRAPRPATVIDGSQPPLTASQSVPAALPPVQAPPQPASAEAIGTWRTALAAWLAQHRTYPDAARREGVEGRAVVRFTIDASGLVTEVALVSSSGSAVLDEAAEVLLRRAQLPPPPPPVPGHLSITLPLRYSLAP
jgi:protein TonB